MQGFCEWCNQEVPYGADGRCFLGHPASALRKGTLTGTMQTIVEPPVDAPKSAVAEAMDDVTAAAVDRDTSDLLAATLASALASTPESAEIPTENAAENAAETMETFEIPAAVDVADVAQSPAPGTDTAGLDEELSPETVFGTAHPAGDDGDGGISFGVPDAVEQWSEIPIPDSDIPVYEYRPPKRDADTDGPRAAVATLARPTLGVSLTGLETVPEVPSFVTFGVDAPAAAAPTVAPAAPGDVEVAPLPAFAHDADDTSAAADVRRGNHELGADVRLRVMLAVLAVVAVVAAVYAAVAFA